MDNAEVIDFVLKLCLALMGNPSQRYGVILGIWDHRVLPATLHK